MICEPCQVPGHTGDDCDDAHRRQLMYRSCPCQHRPIERAKATIHESDTSVEQATGRS